MQLPIRAGDGNASFAKREDWEAHREIISRLWCDEDRPLKEVIAIMSRDYDFHATMKMFKYRLGAWGLQKYLKPGEAKRLRSKARTGENVELPMVRGRQLGSKRLRAMANKFEVLDCVRIIEYDPASQCYTPLRPNPPAPDQFRLTESSIHAILNYSSGRLEAQVWDLSAHDLGDAVTRNWAHDMNLAAVGIYERRNLPAQFALLNQCCDMYRSTLRRQEPLMVCVASLVILKLTRAGDHLATSITKFMREICTIELGLYHPITVLWTNILTVGLTQAQNFLMTVVVAQLDAFRKQSKPGDSLWVVASVSAMTHFYLIDLCSAERLLDFCDSVVRELEEKPGPHAFESEFWINFAHSTVYDVLSRSRAGSPSGAGPGPESVRAGSSDSDNTTSSPEPPSPEESMAAAPVSALDVQQWRRIVGTTDVPNKGRVVDFAIVRGKVEEGCGRLRSSEYWFCRAIELALTWMPDDRSRVTSAYNHLESFYRSRGDDEAADTVCEELRTALEGHDSAAVAVKAESLETDVKVLPEASGGYA